MKMIEIIVRDDDGTIIRCHKRQYNIELSNPSFNAIEAAVDSFKNQAVIDLKADLLQAVQNDFIKKTNTSSAMEPTLSR